jgi:subtilisin family serine protease
MKKLAYRFLVVLSFLSILAGGGAGAASAAPWQSKVDPWVMETGGEGETEFLVTLTTQADLSQAAHLSSKLEKGWYVYQRLTTAARSTQGGLIAELERMGVEYRPYWIVNMVWVRGGMDVIRRLAERPDVAHVYANPIVRLETPLKEGAPEARPQEIEWNIIKVGAPEVWALGYTGQGVVIGGQDTGYQWDHPALKNQYRGWTGSMADHNYNWKDATGGSPTMPVDPHGHGTHTMGTMVGDDGGSNQIGMAPGARWIGCRNMEETKQAIHIHRML